MNASAVTKISFHEHCAYNGPENYHVRAYLTYEKAREIGEAVAQGANDAPNQMFGCAFKAFGLDCEVYDGEAFETYGWQALNFDGAHVNLNWSPEGSYIDLSVDKGLTTDDFWNAEDGKPPLPATFWIQAAHIIRALTTTTH